jgi:hypothetical protein
MWLHWTVGAHRKAAVQPNWVFTDWDWSVAREHFDLVAALAQANGHVATGSLVAAQDIGREKVAYD